MQPNLIVDTSKMLKALHDIELSAVEMLHVEGAGAKVQVNRQKNLVPVDTAATKLSIKEHYEEISAHRIVDNIGAETTYAPNIEFGRADMPNYPMQPFVRPAAHSGLKETVSAISSAVGSLLVNKW